MIFKLNINVNNIQKYIDDLKNDYNIYYCLNNLYASAKDVLNITLSDFIKKYKYQNIIVDEINENNLKYENSKVIDWCKNELVNYDVKKFEIEHQKQLNDYMIFLDDLSKELKKISKEKRGDEDGRQ